MRVLVLGGTGLISTAIVERLIERGHEPVLFNRGKTPPRFGQPVQTITGDRHDFAGFERAMAGLQADAVIDMITFDFQTAAHNVSVFKDHIRHFVFCSTVCVYGGPLSRIPADDDEPHTPVSGYGRGKSEAERAFMEAHREHGFPVTILRPAHCYGPGRALLDIWGYNAAIVNRFRQGKPVLVHGDGAALWQPGYVGDMAKAFVGALGRDITLGKAYNAVGDEAMTWEDFLARMARALGLEAELVYMTTAQLLAGTPESHISLLRDIARYHCAFSNARLKADVPEFSDLMTWEEGVRITAEWMDREAAHQSPDSQPWVDALVERARAFEEALARTRAGG